MTGRGPRQRVRSGSCSLSLPAAGAECRSFIRHRLCPSVQSERQGSAATWPSASWRARRNAVNQAAGSSSAPPPGDVGMPRGARRGVHRAGTARSSARVSGAQSEPPRLHQARSGADIRRSFELCRTLGSASAGGSATLYGRRRPGPMPNVDLGRLHGWGRRPSSSATRAMAISTCLGSGLAEDGNTSMSTTHQRAGQRNWGAAPSRSRRRSSGVEGLAGGRGELVTHVAMGLDVSCAA
jgi:hypothetical protein